MEENESGNALKCGKQRNLIEKERLLVTNIVKVKMW